MWRNKVSILLVTIVLTLMTSHATAWAKPYYEGKTINIIVGFGPGGGYDRIARLLAKHLPKHIPGRPTIIVQNMVGGAA